MEACGRHFSPEVIRRIEGTVKVRPSISRRTLSREVCQWMNWRGPNGKLQEMSCRKALLKLQEQKKLALPKTQRVYPFQRRSAKGKGCLPELREVRCSLGELGEVEVFPVTSRYSKMSGLWNALMKRYHYLGNGPLCGAQMRYVVRSEKQGWLGALSFSAGTWRLKKRDEWIGWSEKARRAHLREVISNSRFLILPTVHVVNLASHVLSRCLNRLRGDWRERYGYEPVLVETFVDPRRFRGTSYQAANWIHVGQTASRGSGHPNGKVSDGPKDIYVKVVREDWKDVLCAEPQSVLGSRPGRERPSSWVEEELGSVELYDERLKARLYRLGQDFFQRPGALVPQACNGSKAKTKAAYRFFRNPQVDMETLVRPHIEATVGRMTKERVVLAVQDSTTLNYSAHPATEDLGPIHTTQNDAVGLILHDTLAFNTEGTPLGLLNVQCWARDSKEAGKTAKRQQLPIEAKESMKWLKSYRAAAEAQAVCAKTVVVSVGDREADIYELFAEALANPSGPKLLVRADRGRDRRVEEGDTLWAKMEAKPIAGYQELLLPRKGSRPARRAKLAVRYAELSLMPPRGKDLPPVHVWAVLAQEVDYSPSVNEPVEWMLLTTVPTTLFEEACERIRWYTLRWGIEVYHRTLKSGCRIEDRRLGDAKSLKACLAIDMVVAWRIYLLMKQGRETPNISCEVYLSEDEWKALHAYVKEEFPPKKPPTLRQTVRMIASLGGFLGRNGDGEPGTTMMWRGLQRLADITKGFVLGRTVVPRCASP
ncbi:MAG: IS4 family transposase [Planctomycetes bacterium]|nr:IS4 family transposase [Planctomycetota bacterium]